MLLLEQVVGKKKNMHFYHERPHLEQYKKGGLHLKKMHKSFNVT